MIEIISQPWHWAISGAMIAVVMYLLLISGEAFGVSSSFRALCSAAGAGKSCSYFDYKWQSHYWLFFFVGGSMLGGFIASSFLSADAPVAISQNTIDALSQMNISTPSSLEEGKGFIPESLFKWEILKSPVGWIMLVGGGFFIGFGTRWAGGCTSGHAISGLSNLQMPSLVAVMGFFIGGLLMTHFLLPIILNLSNI